MSVGEAIFVVLLLKGLWLAGWPAALQEKNIYAFTLLQK